MSATLSFPRCGDRDTLLKAAPPPNPPFSTSPFLATLRLLPRPALPLLNCNARAPIPQ